MINDILPSIFISHGAPTLPMEDVPAKRFLVELGRKYRDVEAVLCISAHWETTIPTINITETHGTRARFLWVSTRTLAKWNLSCTRKIWRVDRIRHTL